MPANARADVRVSAFYYPWYGTSAHDGAYQHWSQRGHAPPDDIASAYYPARGLYSSSDRLVVGAQMDEIRNAGIDEITVSWWGRGSPEDSRLRARRRRLRGQTGSRSPRTSSRTPAARLRARSSDVAYLRLYGIRTFYVYRALDLPVADWAASRAALHAGGSTLFAQTAMVGAAAAAGFDGVYTYDIVTFGGGMFGAAVRRGACAAPAVRPVGRTGLRRASRQWGPGRQVRGGTARRTTRCGAPRLHAGADRVTITSYNEWHEGTQIEPAATTAWHGRYRYYTYDGAWGLHGHAAESAYLVRTRYWSDVFRSTAPAQPNSKAP